MVTASTRANWGFMAMAMISAPMSATPALPIDTREAAKVDIESSPESPLLAVPKNVCRALDDYSADPAHMESHREKLAREIERLTDARNRNQANR